MIFATAIFLSLAASSLAQSNWTIPAGFDLNQVTPQTRSSWCLGQRNSCPKICGGSASVNRCEPSTLEFTCTCSNGTEANVAPYQVTIPFYVCQENYGQCIGRSNTQDGDEECKAGLAECGTLNASAPDTATSTTSTSTTLPTETSSSDNDSNDSNEENQNESEPTTTDSSEDPEPTDGAMRLMQNYGLSVFATVVVAAFAML
ncbi:hypothetical protein BJY04DRAFT_192225 [Aspergillus karnatakaensis]|uniref:uncharacterized protein n=1 Tax=Aspergillus karnatakaensis TaxID=1810916 RepID=UPI003CCE3C1F